MGAGVDALLRPCVMRRRTRGKTAAPPRLARAILSACVAYSGAGCSGIPGDIDLAPAFRTAHHPGDPGIPESGFTDTDILGPIVPFVEGHDSTFTGVRPLFTTTERPFAEGPGRERVVSFLAPFGKYHSNPRTTQTRLVPLFWYTVETTADGHEDRDFIIFPFFWIGKSNPPEGARGTGEVDEFHFALFPLIGQLSEFLGYQKMQFLAWPIFQRLYKRTYFDEDDPDYADEAITSLALLVGWTTGWPRGGSWHVLPLFMKSVWNYPPYKAPRYPDGADPSQPLPYYDKRSYLWPFIHYQRLNLDRGAGNETTLLAVWPFFKREVGIDREFWTILWPFFRYNREYPLKRESGALARGFDEPQPDEIAKAPENTNVLIDVLTQAVFRYESTQDYWRRRILWLLFAEYHSRPESPQVDENGEIEETSRIDSLALLQPIGFWKRRVQERFPAGGGFDDDSLWLLTPFFQTHRRSYVDESGAFDGRTDRFTRLWPVFSYERKADGSRDIYAIPLLPLRLERFVKDFNDAWAPFLNLYRYQRAPDRLGGAERHTALFTLIKAYRDARESSLSIPILFTSREVEDRRARRFSRRALLGMFGYEGEDAATGESSRTLRLFWLPLRLR